MSVEYRDADWLQHYYVENRESHREMADRCGVDPSTIQKWLRKTRVTRPEEDWVDCGLCDRDFRSKEGWFSHVTQVHKGTAEEDKARRWLSEENPNADGLSEEQRKNLSESLQGREITEEQREKISESLCDYYDENGFTESQKEWHETCKGEENPAKQEWFSEMMSGENNPAKRPEVRQKISENNPMKDPEVVETFRESFKGTEWPEEAKERRRGEGNPNWRGGVTEDDPWNDRSWRKIRRKALERDEYMCQDCGITQEEHEEERGRGLDVHHIIPVREFDDFEDAHYLENLVSLCFDCHKHRERGI